MTLRWLYMFAQIVWTVESTQTIAIVRCWKKTLCSALILPLNFQFENEYPPSIPPPPLVINEHSLICVSIESKSLLDFHRGSA